MRGCVARGCGGAGGRAEQCQDGFARASGNSRGAAGPLIEPGGGARAAPRRAPLAARAAAAGSPLAAAQTMGHGRLKEPASAATAVMSLVRSQRGGRRGEQSHAPRATSAPAASAPPLRRVRRRAGVRGGGEIMRVKNKNNNSNAGEPALPSPIALPRGRWWSRGNPVPSVPRWPSLVPLVHCVFGGPQKLWPQQPRPPLGGAGRGGPPSLPRRNAGFPPVCLFYSKKKTYPSCFYFPPISSTLCEYGLRRTSTTLCSPFRNFPLYTAVPLAPRSRTPRPHLSPSHRGVTGHRRSE